jgi:hypothetical protein
MTQPFFSRARSVSRRAALVAAALAGGSLWLAAPNPSLAAGSDPDFEVVFAWEEVIDHNGQKVRVRGERVRDRVTEREFTDYLALDGEPLDADFILGNQKNWDGPARTWPGEFSPERDEAELVPVSVQGKSALGPAAIAQTVSLGRINEAELRREDAIRDATDPGKAYRIGIVRDFTSRVALGTSPVANVGWVPAPAGGGDVWLAEVSLEGAQAIRLHLENLNLPQGVELWVFNPDDPTGDRVGPYTVATLHGETELWTGTVFSERAILECFAPAGVDKSAIRLAMGQASHIYAMAEEIDPRRGAGNCHNDVTCRPDWATEASGVARFSYVSSGSTFLCSGALINDMDPNSFVPYFMTGYHCVSTQPEASSSNYFWFYQTNSCNGSVPSLSAVPQTLGADFLAGSPSFLNNGSSNDFSFVRHRQSSPGGTFFMGWTTTAPPLGEPFTGIHHPSGSFKRISFGNRATTGAGLPPGAAGQFWEVRWNDGVTEQGSSGSPLYNNQRQFIGQLCCGTSECASPSDPDYYGRFDLTFPTIQGFLAGTPPCSYSISPLARSVSAAGGSGFTVNVTAGAGCNWSASESASWLTINSGASGTSNGTVTYTVAANSGDARAATIVIAGNAHFVSQEAGNGSVQLLTNISTRGLVGTGDNIMIAGFVISGSSPKTVLITGRGPGLADFGVPNVLPDPMIRLFSGPNEINSNNNWVDNANSGAITATGRAPTRTNESALLLDLNPGPYTVHLAGVNNGTGNGLIEVWEVVSQSGRRLSNISTRGQVGTGNNVMIAGFIIGDSPSTPGRGAGASKTVMIKALGPSLASFGVPNVLSDPTLTLFSGQTQIGFNDDWDDSGQPIAEIQNSGLAPTNGLEAVILQTLAPGAYTVHVAGFAGATGNGLVEVWEVE